MANNASEFSKGSFNSSPMKSSKTPTGTDHSEGARAGAVPAKSRGVEHPVPTDAALIGDTRHELHTKALPRRNGPNFGFGTTAPTDQLRVDEGEGEQGAM